jgi:hypothetical protein
VVSFTRRPLYRRGKSPWYAFYIRLGGPQNLSGRRGEEKNLFITDEDRQHKQIVACRKTSCSLAARASVTARSRSNLKAPPMHFLLDRQQICHVTNVILRRTIPSSYVNETHQELILAQKIRASVSACAVV